MFLHNSYARNRNYLLTYRRTYNFILLRNYNAEPYDNAKKDFHQISVSREFIKDKYCVVSVGIQSYSGPYFPAFGLNTERNWKYGLNNSEHGHFWRSESFLPKFTKAQNVFDNTNCPKYFQGSTVIETLFP